LSTLDRSFDFMQIKGDQKLTISLFGCRMRNYESDQPITLENTNAVVQAFGCLDKNENEFNLQSK
jgi:hypothetical protein